MSAVVDIVLASYSDVLKVPVAAIVESADGYLCWIRKDGQIERRNVTLGDTNDEYTVVESGLSEGDEVVLNPLSHLEQAEQEALKPGNSSRQAAHRLKILLRNESEQTSNSAEPPKKEPPKMIC